VHLYDEQLLCDPCFNITRADTKKWRWVERQEATILSIFYSCWPEDQTIEHTLLDFGEVELATNFFQLVIKPLPIRERWRAFIDGLVGEAIVGARELAQVLGRC
jgi:hypothetical protein